MKTLRTFFLPLLVALPLRAAPVNFDIPAQPAGAALVAFAKQARIEVLFAYADLNRLQSSPVVGTFEPKEALDRLLRGTGYTAQRIAAGKFVVTREDRARADIRGRLLSATDGAPVGGAVVRLADDPRGVRTGPDGAFLLRNVPVDTTALAIA
ncbi:MAG: hypothetical protein FJ399_18870, partial [Verrucomicrobia bacterium]|nr:hypothetical protein [Verrucomicrobiota bacterium]